MMGSDACKYRLVMYEQVMKPIEELHYLSLDSTLEDAINLLECYKEPLVPVVDSSANMALQVWDLWSRPHT